jgi:hypothetical protein
MTDPLRSSWTRVFLTQFRAGPSHVPEFLTWAAPLSPEHNFGDVTPIFAPSSTSYGQFDEVGEVVGAAERPTITLRRIYSLDKSLLLQIAERGCPIDVQIHMGKCKDPRNHNQGWEKILAFENARISTWSADELGALTPDDNNPVNEEAQISASAMYEILPMVAAERAASTILQEIIKTLVCDDVSCGGDCGDASTGCSVVFSLSAPVGSSPGLKPAVIYTEDGYSTAGSTPITTLSVAENPSDGACIGDYLVVISQASISLHYALKSEILTGVPTWTEVSTGFVGAPTAIDSVSPIDTIIVGLLGYVYKTLNPLEGVTVKDAGSAAGGDDLFAVDMFDAMTIVAGGENSTVIYSLDGGDTWATATKPDSIGLPQISVISLRTDKEWWAGTADGKLYYSTDTGVTWTEKTFPNSGAGEVDDLKWASQMVGFMVHNVTVPAPKGRALRTIDGGQSWYILPEGTATFPLADDLNSIALCPKEVNVAYFGGLADNAVDGVVIKAAG